MRIPICKPQLDGAELAEVAAVLQSGWLMQGAKTELFERLIADYIGSTYAVATTSCSTALHLAMRQCRIGPGDEVIVPSLTWVATAAAVEDCGGRPVFCDIDPETFNIDANQVETLISPSTKAIIAVNLFGLAADLPRLSQIAYKRGLYLIEDAACSLGATVDGRQSGTFGRMGCFSFHPRKSITTGEGGMIVGHCREDESSLRSLRSHGFLTSSKPQTSNPPHDLGDFDKVGYNYRMTDLQAAVGVAQMKKLDGIIARRREIASIYRRELKGIQLFRQPAEPEGYFHTYQSYVVMIQPDSDEPRSCRRAMEQRNKIMLCLQSEGIATRPGTHAVHTLSYYRQRYELTETTCPNATDAMNLSIALPLYPSMTESEIEYVIVKCHSALTEIGSGPKVATH